MKNQFNLNFLIIFSFLFSPNIFANFSKLAKEFLTDSLEAKQFELKNTQSLYEFNLTKDKNNWNFVSGITKQDSYLDALFSFQGQRTITNSFNVGIERKFDYGTSLILGHERRQYDLSNWQASALTGNVEDTMFETRNKISISQDLWKNFFGRNQILELNEASINKEINFLLIKKEKTLTLYNLYKSYINARKLKTLLQLNLDSVKNKDQTYKMMQKRYADNISSKADLYTAQISLINAKEKMINTNNSLIEVLQIISDVINRKYDISELQVYDYISFNPKEVFEEKIEDNIDLLISNKTLNKLEESSKRISNNKRPELKLSYTITNNDIDQNQDTSIKEAYPFEERKEEIIALNFKVPIGDSIVDAQNELNNLNIQKEKIKLRQKKRDLISKILNIKERIKLTDEHIRLGRTKLNLGNNVQAEYDRLFNKGQIDFEQLLRSKDEVVFMKANLIDSQTNHDLLMSEYYYLNSMFIEKIVKQ